MDFLAIDLIFARLQEDEKIELERDTPKKKRGRPNNVPILKPDLY